MISIFIHLKRATRGGKSTVRWWYFPLILRPKKEHVEWPKRFRARFALPPTWFRVLTSRESPMNLQPGPSQSIVELPKLAHFIEQPSPRTFSYVIPLSRPTSSFLTIRIPHGTLQNNGVAGGRTNRLAERTTLHFYISMQNGEKKNRSTTSLRIFHFSSQPPTFLSRYLANFIEYRRYIARLKI